MLKLLVKTFLAEDNKFRKCYDMRKRAKNIKKAKGKIPPYLVNNNFEVELNFKLWVTKGARFKASERCEGLDRRSTKIVGWLSAYLIIFSVLNMCNFSNLQMAGNLTNFISISLSIMILVFSQFEYAMGYSAKSKAYHDCALKISELYDRLRILKNDITADHRKEIQTITAEYQHILEGNINHLPIDYKIFTLDKPVYFNLSELQIWGIRISYYLKTRFAFHILVYGVPLAYIIYIYCK